MSFEIEFAVKRARSREEKGESLKKIRPGRHLLIASTGGHLAQLVKWSSRINSDEDSLWITFDSAQSRSLLEGKRALLVPYIPPRSAIKSAGALRQIMRQVDWEAENFVAAVSTGAALAVPGLYASRWHRIPSFYIESVSRVNGPSLSGKIVATDRRIDVSCQYENWADGRWSYRGTILDQFGRFSKASVASPSIFVTLGTIKPYRFDSLVDAVLKTGLTDDRTIWQVGCTSREDLPGKVFPEMSSNEFDAAASAADIVVTHSGVGTILRLLDMGIYPVVVPRIQPRGEHVDNHQMQIASVVSQRKIGAVANPDEIDPALLIESSGFYVKEI